MKIRRIEIGPRMSQAAVHGDAVYMAGQVALGKPGASVGEQTRNILDRIDARLAEAGSSKSKLPTATIWLTDMNQFAEMNAVSDAWVAAGSAPFRACVESTLASPDYAIEIQVTAAL
jgi:enamine deaminase RidA (YjgF/YER057c/UK114 family)